MRKTISTFPWLTPSSGDWYIEIRALLRSCVGLDLVTSGQGNHRFPAARPVFRSEPTKALLMKHHRDPPAGLFEKVLLKNIRKDGHVAWTQSAVAVTQTGGVRQSGFR
jgi:hypothetical protein